MESRLEYILADFWVWAGYDGTDFAKEGFTCSDEKEPFYYPELGEMRTICGIVQTKPDTDREVDDYLTCMALDNEEEGILDHCAAHAPDAFVEQIAAAALNHPQWHARWQVAELLGRRKIPQRDVYLHKLLQDSRPYVRRRAHGALESCAEFV